MYEYKYLQHALAHVQEVLVLCALYDDDLPVDILGPLFGQVALHHFFVPFSSDSPRLAGGG